VLPGRIANLDGDGATLGRVSEVPAKDLEPGGSPLILIGYVIANVWNQNSLTLFEDYRLILSALLREPPWLLILKH
jgi:hypothetical protein